MKILFRFKTNAAALLRRCKKRFIYIALLAALSLVFRLLTKNRAVMNFITDSVTHPIRRTLASLSAVTNYSVAEWVVIAAFLFAAGLLILFAVRLIRRKHRRGETCFTAAVSAAAMLLTVVTLMNLLWNANYYADSFRDKSGLSAGAYSVKELYRTTCLFAKLLREESRGIPRDSGGRFAADIEAVFDGSAALFRPVTERYPFLGGAEFRAKKVRFSVAMSFLETTGVAFPFTGEANINTDQPAAWIPVTIAHEIAHQRKVASEQEANFVAVVACDLSGSPVYRYSGYLLAYTLLANALAAADYDLYRSAAALLDEGTLADLQYHAAYWRQFEGPVSDWSDGVYDGYLKGQGQSLGTGSYGAAADLLIAYYGDAA